MRWQPSAWLLAQDTHIGYGMALIGLAVASGHPWWYGFLGILVIELPKEFGFDLLVEGASVLDGLVDLSVWLAGGAFAYLFLAGAYLPLAMAAAAVAAVLFYSDNKKLYTKL